MTFFFLSFLFFFQDCQFIFFSDIRLPREVFALHREATLVNPSCFLHLAVRCASLNIATDWFTTLHGSISHAYNIFKLVLFLLVVLFSVLDLWDG